MRRHSPKTTKHLNPNRGHKPSLLSTAGLQVYFLGIWSRQDYQFLRPVVRYDPERIEQSHSNQTCASNLCLSITWSAQVSSFSGENFSCQVLQTPNVMTKSSGSHINLRKFDIRALELLSRFLEYSGFSKSLCSWNIWLIFSISHF